MDNVLSELDAHRIAAIAGVDVPTVRRFLAGKVAQRSSRARSRIIGAVRALERPAPARGRSGASLETLRRRAAYGGRKGRSAARRLRAA